MTMHRIAEPEKMTTAEELFYAQADYAIPHEELASDILTAVGTHPNLKFVDLGCGPGDILVRLRQRVQWQLFGVDFSANMLAHAKRREQQDFPEPSIIWHQADIKATSLPDYQFDAITSNSVLHHLSDLQQFWREIKRLSKAGAFVLVRDLRRPASHVAALQLVRKYVGKNRVSCKSTTSVRCIARTRSTK
jgi:ubiquinone/menaquinone biosynthesis C-methylase UbiE